MFKSGEYIYKRVLLKKYGFVMKNVQGDTICFKDFNDNEHSLGWDDLNELTLSNLCKKVYPVPDQPDGQ